MFCFAHMESDRNISVKNEKGALVRGSNTGSFLTFTWPIMACSGRECRVDTDAPNLVLGEQVSEAFLKTNSSSDGVYWPLNSGMVVQLAVLKGGKPVRDHVHVTAPVTPAGWSGSVQRGGGILWGSCPILKKTHIL